MSDTVIIEKIGRRGRLAEVTISGGLMVILDKDFVRLYHLEPGAEIPGMEFARIRYDSDCKRARHYVTYLLTGRGYSIGLLRNKLIQKGFEPKVTKTVISEFADMGLLDDTQYARQTIDGIIRRKPAGKGFLVAYLVSRQIPRKLAVLVVDEYMKDVDEVEIAYRLLTARRQSWAKLELETARTKAYNYLSRRAISYRAARIAFDKLMKEENQN